MVGGFREGRLTRLKVTFIVCIFLFLLIGACGGTTSTAVPNPEATAVLNPEATIAAARERLASKSVLASPPTLAPTSEPIPETSSAKTGNFLQRRSLGIFLLIAFGFSVILFLVGIGTVVAIEDSFKRGKGSAEEKQKRIDAADLVGAWLFSIAWFLGVILLFVGRYA